MLDVISLMSNSPLHLRPRSVLKQAGSSIVCEVFERHVLPQFCNKLCLYNHRLCGMFAHQLASAHSLRHMVVALFQTSVSYHALHR